MEPGELLFGAAMDPGQVSAALASKYRLQVEPPKPARWTCLDTADWRLHRSGMELRDVRQGQTGRLFLTCDGQEAIAAPLRVQGWPRRVDSLPASPLRDRIAAPVGARALLPLAEVDVRSLALRVLDGEGKTRVRIWVDQQRLLGERSKPLPLRVVVSPLRGYERDGRRCLDLLGESILPLPATAGAATGALLAAGHVPGQPAVPPAQLDPQAPAVVSLANMLRRWMDVIDSVRPGVLADIDVEYLHDMRTSVRATRSLLRLAVDLLPHMEYSRFAAEFAWLSRLTTPLRDLDVALLELDGHGALDLTGLDDLVPLRQHLAVQRRRALATLRSGLESPRGVALSSAWRAALNTIAVPPQPGPDARGTAAAYATAAYRRIVKAVSVVTEATPADHLHRLRRRCKQMRYLLDSYASVYPPEPHREVLTALKSLQVCLGDIQDVDVQRRQLTDLASTLTRRGVRMETVLAIGALRDRASRRDAAARRTLARRLDNLCSAAMHDRVRELATVPS